MVLFAENDLQLKASYGSSPPCTPFLRVTLVIHMCQRDSRICVTYIVLAHTYADYVCMHREVSCSHYVCRAIHTYSPHSPTYSHTSLCPFFRSCHFFGRGNECRSACHLQKKKKTTLTPRASAHSSRLHHAPVCGIAEEGARAR